MIIFHGTIHSRAFRSTRKKLGELFQSTRTSNSCNIDSLYNSDSWKFYPNCTGNNASYVLCICDKILYYSIGYNHDVTEECPDKSYIMATVIPAGPASFTWSTCSRDFVQSFLRFVDNNTGLLNFMMIKELLIMSRLHN